MQLYDAAIVLSGPLVSGDEGTLADMLKQNPSVTTLVLYDSPGGDGLVMQHMSAIIRGRKLATAVAGNCASACAMVFLSGVER